MLTLLHTFTGHQNPVYALANSAKPGIFFSAGNDKGIVEWSLKKMAFVMVKWPVKSTVYCLHSYQDRLFAGERNGTVTGFDFIEQKLIADFKAHHLPVFDIKVLKTKNELLSASEDGQVAVWSLNDFSEIFRFRVAADTIRTIAVSPDEKELAFGCKDNIIRIYSAADFGLLYELAAHTHPVTSLAYHPDGKYLISGSRDAQLNIWSLPGYQLSKTIPAHLFAVYDIVFHPALPYFATASQDKSIKIWDADNFALYKILSVGKSGLGHTHSVNALIWSNDGQYLISSGDDRKVMVWDFPIAAK